MDRLLSTGGISAMSQIVMKTPVVAGRRRTLAGTPRASGSRINAGPAVSVQPLVICVG
jgi:hypothetical protein